MISLNPTATPARPDTNDDTDDVGPTAADLAAIDAEWPVIEAELDELDAVIRIISAAHDPDELEVRRYRRAQRRVLREMRAYLDRDDHAAALDAPGESGEVA
jgi:hypothetical protein